MLYKLWKWFVFGLVNHILAGTHFFRLKRVLLNSCQGISIGKNTKVVAPITVYSELVIADNCWIGRNFVIEGNGKVSIGNCCNIAPSVHLFTGSHQIGEVEKRAGKGFCGAINIGDGCWICGGVKVIPNVSIGSGSVVACGGVVTTDILPNLLVGGVPAKKLKELSNE